jgi:TolA-binding protein
MSRLSSLEVNLRLRMLLAVGCSLCFAAPQVWSQVTAHAAVAAASPDAQLKQLRQQLSALEGRVHELEKKADDVKNNDEDDAQAKKFERRLAAIESSCRSTRSHRASLWATP